MRIALGVAALAACLAGCHGGSPQLVSAGLLACGKIQDAGERVRCYDAQVAAMKHRAAATSTPPPVSLRPAAPAQAAAAPKAQTRPLVAVAATTPESSLDAQFGAEELSAAAHRGARKNVLVSRITALRALAANRYVVSLANGQVWRQAEADSIALFFRVGDQARIERGALGSYHMSTGATGEKNWVQVIRIQ